ncbi:alpha-E domain-containing protein [Sphingomonas sp. DT-204]|uniref:alpha-E domain-containing protein n=1 Tax=Sphingomonas sp. DT-204 TaxID=3396166 RepID=UPI003F1A2DB7
MLSRTAENIFWMARYIERAESTARLIQMGQRMAILPGPIHREEWRSVLRVTGCDGLIDGERPVAEADIVHLLLLDETNSSSIRACLQRARNNGRAVRTALTQDMWEALNEDWRRLELYDVVRARRDLAELIDWVKTRASTFRGAVETGQLRNEGHDFLRIGGALERAEMTLRLLDVKYYVLLPETAVIGGGRDHYQWTSVLHALSAARAYHHVYGGGDYTPWRIADLLILNPQFPRSVSFCFGQIGWHLERLARAHGRRSAAHETAATMLSELHSRESGEIFEGGLHEFVQNALFVTNQLSREIAHAYHFA